MNWNILVIREKKDRESTGEGNLFKRWAGFLFEEVLPGVARDWEEGIKSY